MNRKKHLLNVWNILYCFELHFFFLDKWTRLRVSVVVVDVAFQRCYHFITWNFMVVGLSRPFYCSCSLFLMCVYFNAFTLFTIVYTGVHTHTHLVMILIIISIIVYFYYYYTKIRSSCRHFIYSFSFIRRVSHLSGTHKHVHQ